MSIWTDKHVETLKALWPTMTAQELADMFNQTAPSFRMFTRNSVIGKAHRLGLKPEPRTTKAKWSKLAVDRWKRAKLGAIGT
jgi:hypothetical protein